MNEIPINKKFEKLEKLICSKELLSNDKLNGEIPFFIIPYLPNDNNFVDKECKHLKQKLSNHGIEILLIDLFDLSIDILKRKKILQSVLNQEHQKDKLTFLKRISPSLDINSVLAPEIGELINGGDYQAILIKGVGSMFPIVRSHILLNNLQNFIIKKPLVMFYPGIYNNFTLDLFGKFKDDNYYRAFNLDVY